MADPDRTAVPRPRLGQLLLEAGLIDEAALATALARQAKKGGRLGTQLLMAGALKESTLADFLSRQLGVPALSGLAEVELSAVELLPGEIARALQVLPVRVVAGRLWLAMADPSDEAALLNAQKACGVEVSPMVAPELVLSYGIRRFYPTPQSVVPWTEDLVPEYTRRPPVDLEPF